MTGGTRGTEAWPEVAAALTAAQQAVATAAAAPLSARHALHAAVLIDRITDPVFARRSLLALPDLATTRDIPAFRAALGICAPALDPILALAGGTAPHVRLEVLPEKVAPEAFGSLPVADLMVSLYNQGSVPRLMLVAQDRAGVPMQDLLHGAIRWWTGTLGTTGGTGHPD